MGSCKRKSVFSLMERVPSTSISLRPMDSKYLDGLEREDGRKTDTGGERKHRRAASAELVNIKPMVHPNPICTFV